MRNRILILLFFVGFSFLGISQSKTQYIKIADKSYNKGDFQGAVVYYKKAMDYDSLDLEVVYQYAQSLRLTNNYQKAEYYYAKIYKKDGGREYPKSVFWLATMQKMNGKYLESYKTWKHVKTIFRKGNSFENKKAKQEIRGSAFARRAEKYRNDAVIKNIGDGVNTNASEFSPIIRDGVLYFSSLRAKDMGINGEVYDEIYSIKLYSGLQEDSVWKMEKELPLIINSPGFHAANGCFSEDGKQFYFSRCDKLNRCDIMISEFKNGKWKTPKKLNINEAGSSSTQPMSCTINGKEHLFFASNRSGGLGKMDIWYSIKSNNEKFEKPIHTGKYLNSPDNEITPFYNTTTRELYFSSDWHPGLGGFDIFKSGGNLKRLSRPTNLGAPINTQWNEMYYFIDTSSETNYLVSNRAEGKGNLNSTCCNDIYSVKFPREIPPKEVEIITLEDLNNYLPVTLYFHNDRPNPRTTKTTTELNYMTTYRDYINRVPTYRTEYSKGLSGLKEEEAILDIDDFFKDYVEKGVK
ncbi:MAG: tetratricopeptide repeat protein, partial [Flavobacteriales bacterium]